MCGFIRVMARVFLGGEVEVAKDLAGGFYEGREEIERRCM